MCVAGVAKDVQLVGRVEFSPRGHRPWQGQHLEPARFFVPFLFHKLAYDVVDLEIGEPS